jgi:hypothetical protein
MMNEAQVPQWLVRGPFPRFMVLFTRVGLSVFVVLGTTMLAFVIWGLFVCSAEVVEGLDPAAPLLHKLYPIGFLAICIAVGIFGIRSSFRKVTEREDSQPQTEPYSK